MLTYFLIKIMLFIFLFTILLIIIIQYKKERRWINVVSVLAGPYLVLIALNNIFIYRFGFFLISDKVLMMVLCGIVCFYVGTMPVKNRLRGQVSEKDNVLRFDFYHIKVMAIIVAVIALLGLLKIWSMFSSGAFDAVNIDETEGVMGNGLVGHLLNLSYSIAPIVFLYWTYYPRKIFYLLPILLLSLVTFSTLVKYNVIGFIVTLFMFTMLYRKSLLKKAVLTLLVFVVAIFVSNYAFTFALKDAEVDSSFYYNHLWGYCSGSLIYDNYIFSIGIRPDINIGYKLLTFLCALPNMFANRMFDTTLFPHETQLHRPVHVDGEVSNVVDAFGYLYPSKGDILELFCFCAIIMLIGFVSALIYKKGVSQSYKFHTYLAIYLTYFVFFSFFGTFYIVSGPWEILVYSLVIPSLFYKRKKYADWHYNFSRIL